MSAEQQPDEGDEFRVGPKISGVKWAEIFFRSKALSPWLHAAEPRARVSGEVWRAVACDPGPVTRYGGTAQIPVTEEMESVGRRAAEYDSGGSLANAYEVYRAMAALAPVPLVTAAEDRIAGLEAENATLKAGLDLVRDARMLANDGDSPTDVHERAQRVARDILAGQVTRDDRHTVQEALKAAPKEPATIRPLTNTGDARRVGG